MPLIRGAVMGEGDFSIAVSGSTRRPDRAARWNVWETTVLSEKQRQQCSSTNYVWAPSKWGRNNLISNGIDANRIAVVPLGVDVNFFKPGARRERKFRFLMVGKWEVRKYPTGLIRAYMEEFSDREGVELYLHAHNPYFKGFSVQEEVTKEGFSHRADLILGSPCSSAELRNLYQEADCFVLPTRAEGWGLPILEAMACGIPAIVTRYSAPVDFVTDDNGYLIDVAEMVPAIDPAFRIASGLWAEPDISHLRRLMREAFEDHEARRSKGTRARATAERFTWENSAELALRAIEGHLNPSPDQHVDSAPASVVS
jgi:glycosyltransferase involved in cell wall biosynthesis